MTNGPGAGQGGTYAAVPRNPAEAAAMQFYGSGFGEGQMIPGSPIDEPDYVWMGDRYTTPVDIPAADYDPVVSNRLNSGWMTMGQAEAEWFVMDPQTKQMVIDAVAKIDDQVPTDERGGTSTWRRYGRRNSLLLCTQRTRLPCLTCWNETQKTL